MNKEEDQEELALRTATLNELYERAREHIRSKHGFETTQQAFEAMLEEGKNQLKQARAKSAAGLEDMIVTEEDADNRKVLEIWRDLPPDQALYECQASIAEYLTRVQKTDPEFVLFKQENHKDNPGEFDELLKELRKKGFME